MKTINFIKVKKTSTIPETIIYTEFHKINEMSPTIRDTLILLPGGPGGNHTVYNLFVGKLLPYADLILFDPRGCGNSQNSPAKYCKLEQYIEDVESIREFYNISPDKFIVLGASYGSMAALGYSIKYNTGIYFHSTTQFQSIII